MTEQEALNNPKMKTIMLLSGYVRELSEGADYETTTYKLAETLVKLFSINYSVMTNEKMDLIEHMALLRNIANDVTEIMGSTAAADFINAAIEIINDYPSDGKLVVTDIKA